MYSNDTMTRMDAVLRPGITLHADRPRIPWVASEVTEHESRRREPCCMCHGTGRYTYHPAIPQAMYEYICAACNGTGLEP